MKQKNKIINQRKELFTDPELIILDMDGTIVIEPEFYRDIYSKSLYDTVFEERGETGVGMIDYYRANFDNNGQFALMALAIPFSKWADKLSKSDLSGITPRFDIVEKTRQLNSKKIVFTGSPKKLAFKILSRFGFNPEKDFDAIIGWEEPEIWPIKWNCSSFVFQSICHRFQANPSNAWAIGDNWKTDLEPAQAIGIKTIQIQRNSGTAEKYFEDFSSLLNNIERI